MRPSRSLPGYRAVLIWMQVLDERVRAGVCCHRMQTVIRKRAQFAAPQAQARGRVRRLARLSSVSAIGIVVAGCASMSGEPDQAWSTEPAPPARSASAESELTVDEFDTDALPTRGDPGTPATGADQAMIDTTQQTVYNIVHGAATRVDGFFGSSELASNASVRQGRIALGAEYDDYYGLRERLRFKARVRLPAMRERLNLVLGRGDADELIDGSDDENITSLPGRFNDIDDGDWLFGVGYARDGTLTSGWDFGVGIRLATPLEPYARATYRWHTSFNDNWLWRVRPRLFWQSTRGYGASLQSILDYHPGDRWLFRFYTLLVADDAVQGMEWTSKLSAFQKISDKSALSYSLYIIGQTDAVVQPSDYGLELRYRRQFLREYLFVEFLTYLSWPRELITDERGATPGIGIEFEMQFGDWPGRSN